MYCMYYIYSMYCMYFVFMYRYCIYWNYLLLVLVGLVQGMKPHVTHRNHRVGIVRARRCVQNSLEFFLQKQSVKWHLPHVKTLITT